MTRTKTVLLTLFMLSQVTACNKEKPSTDETSAPAEPAPAAPTSSADKSPPDAPKSSSPAEPPRPKAEPAAPAATADTGVAPETEASLPKTDTNPPSPPDAVAIQSSISIANLTLARGVEKNEANKRVPVDPGTSFENDGRRVYAIFDIENPNEEEGELVVGWIPPGGDTEKNKATVTIKPKKSWRTWAFNGFVKTAGMWQVVVRKDDVVMASATFEMKQ